MRNLARISLQIVLEFSAIPIIELTMSIRKQYRITTCTYVNATGGTMNIVKHNLLCLRCITEAQVVILYFFLDHYLARFESCSN